MRRTKGEKQLDSDNPNQNLTKQVSGTKQTKPFVFPTKVDTLFSTDEDLADQDQIYAQKLLHCVITNKLFLASSQMKLNPGLLLITAEAEEDSSKRTTVATPFQAALGTGNKPMWVTMRSYLEPQEALKQFDQWFPKGVVGSSATKLSINYNAIAQAIINGEDQGKTAIETLKQTLGGETKITQDYHFDLQYVIAAYRAYIDNFQALRSTENRNLFWLEVVGWTQHQITDYDRKAYCFEERADPVIALDALEHYAEQKQADLQNLKEQLKSECSSTNTYFY